MRHGLVWLLVLGIAAWIGHREVPDAWRALWPACSAFVAIAVTRHALSGLAAGLAAGCLVAAGGNPLSALREAFAGHLLPSLEGPWRVGALVFTLLLGAFAGLLEHSGGFAALLRRLTAGRPEARGRVLGSVYGLGLLCFFDGLANSLLLGRVARPLVDRAGVSREKLAWVVDSTSSPVACVAFLSTWIATQLSLIREGLPDSDAYTLFFRSIPANPYCVLTLLLVPWALALRWEPSAMRRFRPRPEEARPADGVDGSSPWRVLVPIAVLALGIAASLQIWSGQPPRWFSLDAWRQAAGGQAGPTALVVGALAGLAAAWACLPAARRHDAGGAALQGAAGLLPALVVLILAWALGSVFGELGAADQIRRLLGDSWPPGSLPLGVFGVAALTSFTTGSAWGTMGLLMPLALGVLAGGEGDPAALAPGVIGAVFGGAVFGDHCSPFSDTTIVSALAAGCRPIDHVVSQLPYALAAALAALAAYGLMALRLPAAAATGLAALALAGGVALAARRGRIVSRQP